MSRLAAPASQTGDFAAKPVPAVVKCCAIVRLLDANLSAGLSLANVCATLSITKSHCLQILRTLQNEGWVRYDGERRRYYLAAGLLADVAVLAGSVDRHGAARAGVEKLAASTGLPCVLTRINDDGTFTSLYTADGALDLRFVPSVGHCYPSDVPVQLRARLLGYPPAQARALLKPMAIHGYTPATMTKHEAIGSAVESARGVGYVVGHMEYQDGISSVAAPIPGPDGLPGWILQCAGPATTIAGRESEIGAAVLKAIDRLAPLLIGWRA